jgi:hypothetical protein
MPPFSGIFTAEVLNSLGMEDHQEEVEEEPSLLGLPMEEQLQLLVEQNTNSNVTLSMNRSAQQCRSSSAAQCRSRSVTL